MWERIDDAIRKRYFLMANSLFEGSIGIFHAFLPMFIYDDPFHLSSKPLREVAYEQLLLGRFTGLLMLMMSIISFACQSYQDRSIILGLAFYHTCACLINATIGCGIDGLDDPVRDIFHSTVHDLLAIGFLRNLFIVHPRRIQSVSGLRAPWYVVDDRLELNYVSLNHPSAIEALNAYALIAERLNHHPDVTIENYRNVKIIIRTHCRKTNMSKGIDGYYFTAKDLELAGQIEKVPLRLSKKWIQETKAHEWAVLSKD